LELRLENLEREVSKPGTTVVRTVYKRTSEITGTTASTASDVSRHEGRADPHPQYFLETEAAVLEGRVEANEGDISSLDARVTAVESSVQDLLNSQPRTLVASSETFLIPLGRQVAVYGSLRVEGEINGDGELVVHG
jgi:hypothetical protein